MKIVIFGCGADCKRLINDHPDILDEVIAFTDNYANYESWFGKPFIKPNEINSKDYNYIVIASSKYLLPIFRQCCKEIESKDFSKIISADEYVRMGKVMGYLIPKKVKIDASSLCQLDCPKCYMRQFDHMPVGEGYLRFDHFKKVLDENSGIREIELSNWGEVFLNPELKDILEYAYQKNVRITMLNGVNLNKVSDDILETLVKTQVRAINISIDGASQEVYSIYRRRGNYDRVIEHIEKINYFKSKHNSVYPKLTWQYIIFEHNEHQVLEAKTKATELGMDIFFKLQHDEGYVPKNPEFLKEVTGLEVFSIEDFYEQYGESYITTCFDLFDMPQINWDGKLLGCCRVYDKDFSANVFELGLKKALQTPKLVAIRKALIGEKNVEINSDNPCYDCYIYNRIKTGKQKFINLEELSN